MAGHHEGSMQTMMYSGQLAPSGSGEHMIEYAEEGQMYRGAEPESGRPTPDSRACPVDHDKTPILSERRSINDAQGTMEVLEVHHSGSGHASDRQTLLSPFQTAKVEDAQDNTGHVAPEVVGNWRRDAGPGSSENNVYRAGEQRLQEGSGGAQQQADDTPQQTPSLSQTPTEHNQQEAPQHAQHYVPQDYIYRGHPQPQYVSYLPQHYSTQHMPHPGAMTEASYAQAVSQSAPQGMPPPPPGTHYIPVAGVYPPPPPPMAPGQYGDGQYIAYPPGAPGAPPYGYAYGYPHPGAAVIPTTASGDQFGQTDANAHPGVVFARSNDPRIVRPKVKLTHEDKRRIVEIARSNTSLRQEDIAQQYGVDRSTISKILISAHRWTGPPQPPALPLLKPVKHTGGRFPAIEQRMHEWMDAQHAAGYEIRDTIARDKAKEIAKMMGFTDDRFKASAKWLDKFKERRRQNGQRASVTASFESSRPQLQSTSDGVAVNFSPIAVPPAFTTAFGHPLYWSNASSVGSPSGSQNFMPRSQSSVTLSSTDSNSLEAVSVRQQYQHPNRSEGDLANGMGNSVSDVSATIPGMHSRQRSRSSPRLQLESTVAQPGTVDPASGRAPRTTVSGLQRQNSFHGIASPSPQRSGLQRTQSSASNMPGRRQGKPVSLAASAFGLTPVQAEDGHSPAPSPSTTSSRRVQQNEPQGLQPFTHSMSGMAISPETMSSSGTSSSQSVGGPSNGQPITPLQPSGYTNIGPNGHPPPGMQYYHIPVQDGQVQQHPLPPQHYTYVYAHPGYPPYPAQIEAKQPAPFASNRSA